MSTLREAAQQALEALFEINWSNDSRWQADRAETVIPTLRAALAQQEQEPVAWQWLNSAYFRRKPPANAESGAWNPLYTAPPRREWRGLSKEEIRAALPHEPGDLDFVCARAIEAALKEKNEL